jgi:hypothetical protein
VDSGKNITNFDGGNKGVNSGEENSVLDSDYNVDADLDNKDDNEDVNMASATTGDLGPVDLDQFDDVDGYNIKKGPSMNTNPELWIVEGCDDLDKIGHCHKNAFYVLLKSYTSKKNYMSILFSKKQYNEIEEFCKYMLDGGDLRKVYLKGNKQAYVWHRKYDVIVSPQAKVIVICPTQGQVHDAQSLELSALAQPSYIERAFIDLWKIHKDDHCKGGTFFSGAKERHTNISCEVTKMFTDICPHCICLSQRKRPVAGIKNIVTERFGVRGQVDLIDFQSMPDGDFKYLLNYLDHGVKKLNSMPLVFKKASCIAYALVTIFTDQGLPSILQTDNGGEFAQAANNLVGIRMRLDNDFVDSIISEVKRKKAAVVKERALKKSTSSVFKEGDVVLVPLDDVHRTKVNGASICGVICQIKNNMCTVAVKEGLLQKSYVYHRLGSVPEASNDRALMELDKAYLGWRGMPKITEHEAAKHVSSVGGQGMAKCHCKGD